MKRAIGLFAVASLFAIGCAHTPIHPGARADLRQAARNTVSRMEAKDPSLKPLLDKSLAYVVFPRVGDAGLLIGGGAGSGVLFENGHPTHFAELTHLEAGALVGGQRYAQIVVIRDPQALQALRSGRYHFDAKAAAVILRSGAALHASFDKGVAVFVEPTRGAMMKASLGGERIRLTL